MPIARALIGKNANASNTITTPSGTSTGGSGSIGVIVVSYDPGVTISSVSDSKSNSYTLKGSVQEGTCRVAVYECFNWTGGASHTATVSFSGTAYPVLHLIEVTGAASSSAADIDVPEIETTRPANITSGVLSQANEVVFMLFEQNYSGSTEAYTATPMTMLSSEPDISNYWTSGVASIITSATTSTAYEMGKNGAGSGTSAARVWSYKEAGAGGDVNDTLNDTASTTDLLAREVMANRVTMDAMNVLDSITSTVTEYAADVGARMYIHVTRNRQATN